MLFPVKWLIFFSFPFPGKPLFVYYLFNTQSFCGNCLGFKTRPSFSDRKKAIFLWFLFYTTRKLCVKLTFLSRWNSAVGGILQVLKFQCCHSHHLRHVSVPLGALPVPFLAFRTNVKISGGRPCSYCTYYCHCLYFGYLLIEVERFYCATAAQWSGRLRARDIQYFVHEKSQSRP